MTPKFKVFSLKIEPDPVRTNNWNPTNLVNDLIVELRRKFHQKRKPIGFSSVFPADAILNVMVQEESELNILRITNNFISNNYPYSLVYINPCCLDRNQADISRHFSAGFGLEINIPNTVSKSMRQKLKHELEGQCKAIICIYENTLINTFGILPRRSHKASRGVGGSIFFDFRFIGKESELYYFLNILNSLSRGLPYIESNFTWFEIR
jgi:hypothetical protein